LSTPFKYIVYRLRKKAQHNIITIKTIEAMFQKMLLLNFKPYKLIVYMLFPLFNQSWTLDIISLEWLEDSIVTYYYTCLSHDFFVDGTRPFYWLLESYISIKNMIIEY